MSHSQKLQSLRDFLSSFRESLIQSIFSNDFMATESQRNAKSSKLFKFLTKWANLMILLTSLYYNKAVIISFIFLIYKKMPNDANLRAVSIFLYASIEQVVTGNESKHFTLPKIQKAIFPHSVFVFTLFYVLKMMNITCIQLIASVRCSKKIVPPQKHRLYLFWIHNFYGS